jgi:hypothetical protein
MHDALLDAVADGSGATARRLDVRLVVDDVGHPDSDRVVVCATDRLAALFGA